MAEHRPVPTDSASDEAAALRQTGAAPLHSGDPRRIGPYVPLALLGSGGMGRVYLARAANGEHGLVAVKVIRPEYADDDGFRRRFEREASVHDLVRTPRTPRLCGTGFEDELLWMATEYLPGLDLADAVREDGALAAGTVWRLAAELGQALADLAAAGIVHRDLKPSNVLLSVRGAHVIDFGLSKAVDASALTGTGNRVGTPAYMSPEHLRTGTCDTASDVFSLAGTLVYATTGRAPFGDGTGVDVMHRVAFEEPNAELLGEVAARDPELAAVVSACLAKEPERRPTPQGLIDAAAAHAEAGDWPEPLAEKVLARQRAYDLLSRLPVDRAARLRSLDDRQAAVRGRRAGARRPARSGSAPAMQAAGPPEGLPAGEVRAAAPRKHLLAAAVGVVLCALAAGTFVLVRQDPPSTDASPGSRPPIGGALPGGAGSPGSGASSGTPTSGKVADGAAKAAASPSSPTAARSAEAARHGSPASVTPTPGTSAEATESADGTPPTEATAPWISDCTYYAGSGRTRRGDSGRRVQQVQCMLTKRGYDVGSTEVDGEFGAGTESAVESFQNDKGLGADGVVDHDTWTALRETA